ncbi:MAG: type II CRISPR RNA-guided endonuclease Cas9 [Methanimicrococcus sp.]|nr:type II CRISPR RNA-guided endonuclease Cas9 [Methanimicrococcus sp.]
MAKKIFDDYYLGLDIGTGSVGWAVTDKSYNILNFNGKAMWGVHLFEEGKTAQERRVNRIARRRLERRKQRIKLLQDIFANEMNKVDPLFFERLNESRFLIEDRKHKNHDTLFNDPSFKDKNLFRKYPTIYHLRNSLMDWKEKQKPDIRLLYLACHHIIKYRGHFLFEGLTSDDIPPFEIIFEEMIKILNQECGTDIEPEKISNDVKKILIDKIGVKEKTTRLQELLYDDEEAENDYPSVVKELCKLISGGTATLDTMFSNSNEDGEKWGKLSFKTDDYDEKRVSLEDVIPEKIEILDRSKTIYDWSVLYNLIKEHGTISNAKIASFEQHKKDLKFLKSILKNRREAYKDVFKSGDKEHNYSAYSGCHKNKSTEMKVCSQENFCKYLGKQLESVFGKDSTKENLSAADKIMYDDMMERIKNGTFMPKQTIKDNSLFPNALHLKELKKILGSMKEYYPFLNKKDETDFTEFEKIIKLCTFRIPYYVGPLDPKSNRSWVVRGDGKITPWNFDKLVDRDASEIEFMNRLIGTCTYIKTEKVVPKSSLMYQRYMLYNELNTLTICGERLFDLAPKLKTEMVRDLFENPKDSRKVTTKKIEEYLKRRSLFHKDDTVEISGVDHEIKSTLKSEIQLKKILGPDMDFNMAEDIVRILTVSGDEKQRVKDKLERNFGKLNAEQIDKLSNLKFKDWGRLSEKFLKGVYAPINGENMNILNALEKTSYNLMELLSDKYEFKKKIDELDETDELDGRITYRLVEDLYVSPAVKRGIWRSLQIIKDIVKVTGHRPAKVFIETTREEQESKRTESRRDKLIRLYKGNKDLIDLFNSLNNADESRLRSKDLYAYYMQHGKCMYCGKRIDLNDIGKNNLYDLDHIHPRSMKKDDSILNNLVLVCKQHNQEKSNLNRPLEAWQKKMGGFWHTLKDSGFITAEKYQRLTRTSDFTPDELSGFINRQLVETSQSVKAVAETLKSLFGKDTDIVYVKANTVSDFRNGNNGFSEPDSAEKLKFVKCRSVNDYHHAKDAYLNIVVGNVYDTKFTKDYSKFLQSKEHYNLNKMFSYNVERSGVQAWKAGKDGTIATVQKYMRRNNILFTRFAYKAGGKLYNLNPLKKGKGQYPLKTRGREMDIEKYGGYDNVYGSYFSVVEHTEKKKIVRTIQPVPVMLSYNKATEEELLEYYVQKGLEKPNVMFDTIRTNSMIEIDGFKLHISGRTGDRIIYKCGEQLILPDEIYEYCKKLDNHKERSKEAKKLLPAKYFKLTPEENLKTYDVFVEKFSGKYSMIPDGLAVKLTEKRGLFINLSPEKQAEVLNEVLHGFQCNSTAVNLKRIEEFGGSTAAGVIDLMNNLTKFDSVKLINQSPSGLFEKDIDLKNLKKKTI